jgi:hypothetical protein
MQLICKKCECPFEAKSTQAKWCSPSCKLRAWREANPARFKQHQITYRDKTAKLCKGCGEQLSRDKNHTHCKRCARGNSYAATKRYKDRCKTIFHGIKVQCGCLVCGWNCYGSALDFHHLDDKKEQINAGNWMLPRVLVEDDKCILVCKNCHYGIHHGDVTLTPSHLTRRPDYKGLVSTHLKDGKVV